MGWGSILLEVQLIEIWSLFQCRYDDISQFVQVPLSCNSSVEELWTHNSIRRYSCPDSYSRLVQLGRDRKLRICVTPINTVVTIYVSRKFERGFISPHNLVQESGIILTHPDKLFAKLRPAIRIILKKSVN